MAIRQTADILVKIHGDSADLRKEFKESEKGVKGLSSTMKGALIGGGFAAAGLAAVELADIALGEAERMRRGYSQLAGTVGPELADALKESSEGFTEWGLSSQDVLGLEGYFADVATSIGTTDDAIAKFAPKAAEAAAALSRLNGLEVDDNLDAIAKAATLGEDDLAKLGISLSEAEVQSRALENTSKRVVEELTQAETSAAAYELIMEKLAPKIDIAADAQAGYAEGADELGAKLETLAGKAGTAIEGPLSDLTDWALQGIEGWELFAERMDKASTEVDGFAEASELAKVPLKLLLTPLDLVGGALDRITGKAKAATRSLTEMYQNTPNPDRRDAQRSEAAVIKQIRDYEQRNGLRIL